MGSSDNDSPIRGEKEKGSVKIKRKKETSSSESESGKSDCKYAGAIKTRKNPDYFYA